eukprot:m51a1_g8629 hypothetical protein (1280) ;mRNA; f:101904-108632
MVWSHTLGADTGDWSYCSRWDDLRGCFLPNPCLPEGSKQRGLLAEYNTVLSGLAPAVFRAQISKGAVCGFFFTPSLGVASCCFTDLEREPKAPIVTNRSQLRVLLTQQGLADTMAGLMTTPEMREFVARAGLEDLLPMLTSKGFVTLGILTTITDQEMAKMGLTERDRRRLKEAARSYGLRDYSSGEESSGDEAPASPALPPQAVPGAAQAPQVSQAALQELAVAAAQRQQAHSPLQPAWASPASSVPPVAAAPAQQRARPPAVALPAALDAVQPSQQQQLARPRTPRSPRSPRGPAVPSTPEEALRAAMASMDARRASDAIDTLAALLADPRSMPGPALLLLYALRISAGDPNAFELLARAKAQRAGGLALLEAVYAADRPASATAAWLLAYWIDNAEEPINRTPGRCAELYKYAADLEHPLARNCLAKCFLVGEGVQRNDKAAVKLYLRASQQGNIAAMTNLAQCMLKGVGTEKKPAEGLRILRMAAEAGDPTSQFTLAECLRNGIGTDKNLPEAIQLYTKAAQNGHQRAAEIVGQIAGSPAASHTRQPSRIDYVRNNIEPARPSTASTVQQSAPAQAGQQQQRTTQHRAVKSGIEDLEEELKNFLAPPAAPAARREGPAEAPRQQQQRPIAVASTSVPRPQQTAAPLARTASQQLSPRSAAGAAPLSPREVPKPLAELFALLDAGETAGARGLALSLAQERKSAIAHLVLHRMRLSFPAAFAPSDPPLDALLEGFRTYSADADAALAAALAASTASPASMWAAGLWYAHRPEPDHTRAASLYAASSARGCAVAKALLAECCLAGRGVAPSTQAAYGLLREASATDPSAMAALGAFLAEGRGAPADPQKARECFASAAQSGSPEGMHAYARVLAGEGDAEEAFRWYRGSAQLGYGPAQLELGKCYLAGAGTVRDVSEAVWFFWLAAQQRVDEARRLHDEHKALFGSTPPDLPALGNIDLPPISTAPLPASPEPDTRSPPPVFTRDVEARIARRDSGGRPPQPQPQHAAPRLPSDAAPVPPSVPPPCDDDDDVYVPPPPLPSEEPGPPPAPATAPAAPQAEREPQRDDVPPPPPQSAAAPQARVLAPPPALKPPPPLGRQQSAGPVQPPKPLSPPPHPPRPQPPSPTQTQQQQKPPSPSQAQQQQQRQAKPPSPSQGQQQQQQMKPLSPPQTQQQQQPQGKPPSPSPSPRAAGTPVGGQRGPLSPGQRPPPPALGPPPPLQAPLRMTLPPAPPKPAEASGAGGAQGGQSGQSGQAKKLASVDQMPEVQMLDDLINQFT